MSYEIKYDALTPVENDDIPNIIDNLIPFLIIRFLWISLNSKSWKEV